MCPIYHILPKFCTILYRFSAPSTACKVQNLCLSRELTGAMYKLGTQPISCCCTLWLQLQAEEASEEEEEPNVAVLLHAAAAVDEGDGLPPE